MMRLLLFIGICVFCAACGTASPNILAETPRPEESTQRKFDEPADELTFSIQSTDWRPATIGSDGALMLGEALKKRKSIMVLTGSNMNSPTFEDAIFQLIRTASPETRIVARNSAVLDEILMERGEIPFRQTWEVGGQDVFGRPWMVPEDHPLSTDWLKKKKELKGAEAMLLIDFVKPDSRKLRQMREQVRGGCDALHAELNRGIGHSESYFRNIVTQVNDVLGSEFSREMQTALPFWKTELTQATASMVPGSPDARCFSAYSKYLKNYDDCLRGTCALSPRLHISGAGVIGMDMADAAVIPHDCPTGMGRNYLSELKGIGERVVGSVMADIPEGWAGEFSKVNMLERLDSELSRLCAPAHRRFTQDDLAVAHRAVDDFLENVVTTRISGKWSPAEGIERIAGVGAVTILGRARPQTTETAVMIERLHQIFKPLNKCIDSKRRPVQVVLVDVGTSEVYFSAIVFEEQLFCENMPPQ